MILLALLSIAASESALPSGVTLLHVDRRAPFSTFAIALPLGSDADPPNKSGLAHAAALALEEKVRALASGDQPRAFEHLGGAISVRTGPTASIFYGGAPEDRFDEAMAIVFRALQERPLDEKAAIARAIAERRAMPSDELARAEARRMLYGFAPPEGDVEDLASVTRPDLERILSERTKAESIVLAVAGDATKAEEWTSSMPKGRADAVKKPASLRARGRRIVVIDRTDPAGALIMIARPLAAPTEERLPAMLAAAASLDVLGARAELDLALGFSSISVRAKEGSVAKTAKSALGALDRSRHGPSNEAIAAAKKRAATRADVALQDPSTQALAVTVAKVQGRAMSSSTELAQKVLALGDAEIASAARILSTGDDLAIVVVASATQELVRELAGIPGVRDVSIVSTGDR